MAVTSQSAMFRAMLEQSSFNTHLTMLLGELMQRINVPDESPEVKLIELMGESNSAFLKRMQEVITLMTEEQNG